jgi:cytochrome P450 family 110
MFSSGSPTPESETDTMKLEGPKHRWISTYRLLAKPFEVFPAWKARYGDPFVVPAINASVVVTGRPELIKQIFAADPSTYACFGADALSPILGSRSMLVMSGEPHRRERKLLMPQFHGARMRAYAEMMREVTLRHLTEAAKKDRVTMKTVCQDLTLEIILRAIFGLEPGPRTRAYMEAIVDLIDSLHPVLVFAPVLQRDFGGLGPWAKFRRKLARLDHMLQEQIDRVRAAEPSEHILSMMVNATYEDGSPMEDAHIRDELRTLVTAGHETTAIALCWAVDSVFRDPETRNAIRAEVEALEPDAPAASYAKLAMTDLACKETLRLYPVLPEALRMLRKPLVLGDREIPAGYAVSAAICLVHRDPEIYPDPETFRPSRFAERTHGPTEYLPYGGGHRRCLGAAFADFELRIALATLLHNFDVKLLSAERPEIVRRNVTMCPSDGVPVVLTPRERAAGRGAARPAAAS